MEFLGPNRRLHSKRFRAVYEQRTRNESKRPSEKWRKKKIGEEMGRKGDLPSSFPSPLFHFLALVSFLARPKPKSLFAPKPNRNACYAAWAWRHGCIGSLYKSMFARPCCFARQFKCLCYVARSPSNLIGSWRSRFLKFPFSSIHNYGKTTFNICRFRRQFLLDACGLKSNPPKKKNSFK